MAKLWRRCPSCDKSLWVPEDTRLQPACPECGTNTVASYARPPNAPVEEIKKALGLNE